MVKNAIAISLLLVIAIFGSASASLTVSVALSSTNSIVDTGQYVSLNAIVSGGTPPYTYNFLVFNSVTGKTVSNSLYTGISAHSQIFNWLVPNSAQGNTIVANVLVTDSTSATANSVNVPSTKIGALVIANTIVNGFAHFYGIAINPSGTTVYAVDNNNNEVDVINTATNAILTTINVGQYPNGIAFNPSGSLAYVVNSCGNDYTCSSDGTVSVINVATNTVINTITVGAYPSTVAISPSGSLAYVYNDCGSDLNCGSPSTVSVINIAANAVINTITVDYNFEFSTDTDLIAFNPAGTSAYAANYCGLDDGCASPGTVSVINVAANTVVNDITLGNRPMGIAINASGALLFVAGQKPIGGTRTVGVISTATNSVINQIPSASGSTPYYVATNPQTPYPYIYYQSSVSSVSNSTNSIIDTGISNGVDCSSGGQCAIVVSPTTNMIYTVDGGTTVTVIAPIPYITVNPALQQPTISQSLYPYVAAGLNETYSIYESGGTPPYTYTVYVNNDLNLGTIFSQTSSSNTFKWEVPITFEDITVSGNTTYAYATVTDSASIGQTAQSQDTNSVFVVQVPSNLISEAGEYETITAIAPPFTTGPYTYNFLIEKVTSPSTITHNALYIGVTASYMNFTYQATAADISNSPEIANIIITPTSPSASNSIYSQQFSTYGALSTPVLTVSNTPTVGAGQLETFTATVSGGYTPGGYSLNIIIYNSITNKVIASNSSSSFGPNTLTFNWIVPFATAGNTIYANVIAKDSQNAVTNSIQSSTITIVPANTAVSSTVSGSINPGNGDVFTASLQGAVGKFTYNFTIYNSVTNAIIAYYSIPGNATANIIWPVPFTATGSTVYANVVIEDSYSDTVSTAHTPAITVNPFKQPKLPANIIYYVPIILVNNQNLALSANAPVAIGMSLNLSNPSVETGVGINATKFKQFELPEMNNTEFFFQNGTVMYSWLEGNLTDEQTANNLATNVNSQYALAGSSNVLFWVNWNWPSSFLTSNLSGSPVNTIYMGFAGNIITTANVLFNNNHVGEAPQLSCNNAANTVSGCAAGQYGKYDDGANVFEYYWNFAGTSVPSGWTLDSQLSAVVANGINFTTTDSGNNQFMSYGSVLIYGNNAIDSLSECLPEESVPGGYCITSGLGNVIGQFPYGAGIRSPNEEGTGFYGEYNGLGVQFDTPPYENDGVLYAFSAALSPMRSVFFINYTDQVASIAYGTIGTQAVPLIGPQHPAFHFDQDAYVYTQWYRIRVMPPNGILPGTIMGGIVSNVVPTLSISSNSMIYGINYAVTITAGSPTDTANIVIGNTQVASGVGQQTFTICASNSIGNCIAPGTYQVYGCDVTAGLCSQSNTIVITKGTPTGALLISPSNAIAYPNAAGFNGLPYDIGNQLTWSLYYSGNTLASSSNTLTYNTISGQLSAGSYLYTYNTIGNGNYFAGSATNTLVITSNSSATTTTIPCSNGCYSGSGGTGVTTKQAPVTTTISQTTTVAQTTTMVQQTTSAPQQQVSINITVTPQQSPTMQICNGTANTYRLTYQSAASIFAVNPKTQGCLTITAVNVTSTLNITNPGLNTLIAVNVSFNANETSVNATMNYPCSVPSASVAPFILRNGSWAMITPFAVNATTCAVSFSVPKDPIIGIFELPQSTTAPQQVASPQGGSLNLAYAAVIVMAFIGFLFFLIKRRHRGRGS